MQSFCYISSKSDQTDKNVQNTTFLKTVALTVSAYCVCMMSVSDIMTS